MKFPIENIHARKILNLISQVSILFCMAGADHFSKRTTYKIVMCLSSEWSDPVSRRMIRLVSHYGPQASRSSGCWFCALIVIMHNNMQVNVSGTNLPPYGQNGEQRFPYTQMKHTVQPEVV